MVGYILKRRLYSSCNRAHVNEFDFTTAAHTQQSRHCVASSYFQKPAAQAAAVVTAATCRLGLSSGCWMSSEVKEGGLEWGDFSNRVNMDRIIRIDAIFNLM